MVRLTSTRTGVTVSCDEETPARLGPEWQPVEAPAPKKKPAPRKAAAKAEK